MRDVFIYYALLLLVCFCTIAWLVLLLDPQSGF